MTIAHALFVMFIPVALPCGAMAYIHKYGFGRCLRALAAVIWAVSFAWPAATKEFRETFLSYFRRTMELA